MAILYTQNKQQLELRSKCTCTERQAANSLGDDQLVEQRDESYSGAISKYWELIEWLSRTEDSQLCWMQVCVHYAPSTDGQPLYIWSVRDISGPSRCLETTKDEYTLSLEEDGFPYSPLLEPQRGMRDEMAGLLQSAVDSGLFAVLHLTGFGAVDAVFPRRLLGWREADLLDRSFIGMLSPEDSVFFCKVLRRCLNDGIPQRVVLKVASAPECLGSAGISGCAGRAAVRYIDCDVTVLVPECVQQPVLIVRAAATADANLQQPKIFNLAANADTTFVWSKDGDELDHEHEYNRQRLRRVHLLDWPPSAPLGNGQDVAQPGSPSDASIPAFPAQSSDGDCGERGIPILQTLPGLKEGSQAGLYGSCGGIAIMPVDSQMTQVPLLPELQIIEATDLAIKPLSLSLPLPLPLPLPLSQETEAECASISISMSDIFACSPKQQSKPGAVHRVDNMFSPVLDQLSIVTLQPTPF
ncbi:hypothetical protein BX661DRAFT_182330 [Kickxella alabastrina]|uniref:uncharacterized protein n=1 Tax=Kickxella alabastrina TaxID=61397 RepID=UPI00221E7DE9|nr:uncharacterized protein BX661DRAFT_182330 [Kickxella alabastrina]KAI7827741.1 hypothetical protein BX661DRAFT_182330 [Kickxella alabastrina]